MTRLPAAALVLLPLVLLAGCDKSPQNDRRSASGEVLKGTISDDMLPLDKLRSQGPMVSPQDRKATSEGEADEDSLGEDSTNESSDAEDDEAAPAPAASASATP